MHRFSAKQRWRPVSFLMLIWGHNPMVSMHHFCEHIMWFQDAHSGHNPVSQGSNAHNDTIVIILSLNKGHFRYKTESPWPFDSKHSHWWNQRVQCTQWHGSHCLVTKGHFTHETESPGPLHSKHSLSLVEKVEPVQVRSTLCSRDQHSLWMQDGCKVYTNSYMASNGSCFKATQIMFDNHFLGGKLSPT